MANVKEPVRLGSAAQHGVFLQQYEIGHRAIIRKPERKREYVRGVVVSFRTAIVKNIVWMFRTYDFSGVHKPFHLVRKQETRIQ